jgi:hypothetical protein
VSEDAAIVPCAVADESGLVAVALCACKVAGAARAAARSSGERRARVGMLARERAITGGMETVRPRAQSVKRDLITAPPPNPYILVTYPSPTRIRPALPSIPCPHAARSPRKDGDPCCPYTSPPRARRRPTLPRRGIARRSSLDGCGTFY